jgi:hypothetical protein
MSALGKWLNRPRKRSQSSPTRQILSDFLNRPAPESHQPSYFPPEKHQQHYSSLPTNAGYYNNNTSTPMLITSSFYNLAYPFDQNDSSADEEVGIPVQERITQYRTTSKPMTPSSSTNDLKKPQQQLKHSINKQEQKQSKTVLFVHNRTPPPLTEPPHPLKLDETPADYFGTGSNLLDDVFDEYHPRQSVTCTRPDLVPLQPKRKPTPYSDKGLFHFDFEDDEEDEAQGTQLSILKACFL